MDWERCSNLGAGDLGRLGERLAADFLRGRGHRILARNERTSVGEADLVASIHSTRTLVEVRSLRRRPGAPWPPPHQLDAFDREKARQVRRVAWSLRCSRIDLIAIAFHPDGCDLQWLPEII